MTCKKISELTDRVILKALIKNDNCDKNQVLLYKITKAWPYIIGSEIAQVARIQSINGKYEKQAIIKVFNHCYMMEIHMYKTMIQQKLNFYLGDQVINAVLCII
jgi:hypothetical protein